MRMKDDEWDDIINTNLTSVFRMSKAVLRAWWKLKPDRIINISSVVGFTVMRDRQITQQQKPAWWIC